MGGAVGKVRLTSQGFSLPGVGFNKMCFAGRGDELVVTVSEDHRNHVWSLPDSQGRDTTVNHQSAIALRGLTKYTSLQRPLRPQQRHFGFGWLREDH